MIAGMKSGFDDMTVRLAGRDCPVSVRVNSQAKRLILRYDEETGGAKVTVPRRTSRRQVEKFLANNHAWLTAQQADRQLTYLGDGDVMPHQGRSAHIRFTGQSPRTVRLLAENGFHVCEVGGPAAHAPKRLETWLRRDAGAHLTDRVDYYADLFGVRYSRLSIGDMKSRWGSCSARGTLRFNWRLVLAPSDVLNYVAAHEVAHLLEMNHSPAFWGHVESVVEDWKTHRNWLRDNGPDLMAIRFGMPGS